MWLVESARRSWILGTLLVLSAAVVAFGSLMVGTKPAFLVIVLLLVVVGAYVGLAHPTWFLWAFAAVLGFMPVAHLPGVHVPLTLAFAVAVILATAIHPIEVRSLTTMDWFVIVLIVVSGISMLATYVGFADIAQYVKWFTVTILVVALLRLPRLQLRTFGRVYVVASAACAIVAAGVLVYPGVMKPFKLFGYDPSALRFVYHSGGATQRLAGTYIDPNAAGIGFFVALVMCVVLFEGRARNVLGVILALALLLTLSRAGLFSVIVGVVLMLVFQTMSNRKRLAIVGLGVATFAALAAVPQLRQRVFSSFGSQDEGSSARLDALKEYPSTVAGHWVFGKGWGLAEFIDPETSFTTNYVANAPLLAVYRGGILVGLAFVAMLIYGCYLGYQCLRSRRWEWGFYGGGFIGFSVVALQLDFSTITIPVSTADLSLLIVFLVYTSELARADSRTSTSTAEDGSLGQADVLVGEGRRP